jgi:hypothetical protein
MKVLAVFISLLLVVAPVARADCGTTESILFSCVTASGKRIELCNFGQFIQYSFGRPEAKPEIRFSVPINKVAGMNCLTCGRYISNSVSIPNKGTLYVVGWGADRSSDDGRLEGHVEVVVNGESKALINCATAPITGNTEGILFKEPVDGD